MQAMGTGHMYEFKNLEDLSIGVQRIDGDLYVPRHALPSLLELALLQRYEEIISHLTFKRTTYVKKWF